MGFRPVVFIYTSRYQCLEEAEKFAHTIEAKLVFKPPEKKDFKSVAEHRLKGLKGHMEPVTIEEDDEKIIHTMHPCGSEKELSKWAVDRFSQSQGSLAPSWQT
jgi:hypothetical protein